MLPDFLGSENENWRGQADKRACDFPDSGLRRAARIVSWSFGVETILQHVKIERAEVYNAIIVDGVINAVEFIVCIPFPAFLNQFSRAVQHPAVDFFELFVRKRVARRIEIAKIAKSEAEGVTNLAIRFAELGHHALAHFYVGLVFDGADPQAKQISAPLFTNFDGIERVAERFGHRAALLVERPAVGDHAAIRLRVAHTGGNQPRTLEPSAILTS